MPTLAPFVEAPQSDVNFAKTPSSKPPTWKVVESIRGTALWADLTNTKRSRELSPIDKDDDARARSVLQFASLARQWTRSNKDRGFLLTGTALESAGQYLGEDPDVDQFIRASIDSETRRRLIRRSIITVAKRCAIAFCVIGGIFTMATYLHRNAAQILNKPGLISSVAEKYLYWLGFFQTVPNNVGLKNLSFLNIDISHLTLIAPNFTKTMFKSVNLSDAQFPSAVFIQSVINDSNFSNSLLSNSQFWGALIERVYVRESEDGLYAIWKCRSQ